MATARCFDVGFDECGLSPPPARRYVVCLVDGLGRRLLSAHAEQAPFLHALLREPGYAGVPSTTATSLTSLGTALTPGQHGLVGFTSRVPGTDRLLNALLWDKRVVPLDWPPSDIVSTRMHQAVANATCVRTRDSLVYIG